jgi:hypothetical protein
VVGVGALFLPWADAQVIHFDPRTPPQPDGSLKALRMYPESYPGYRFWHAGAAAGGFLGLLLFLVATGGLCPPPWWRSAVLLAGGGAIAVAVVVGLNGRHPATTGDQEAGVAVAMTWGAATYLALGSAVAIMVLAAIELRGRIAGPRRGPSAEPVVAPDPRRR